MSEPSATCGQRQTGSRRSRPPASRSTVTSRVKTELRLTSAGRQWRSAWLLRGQLISPVCKRKHGGFCSSVPAPRLYHPLHSTEPPCACVCVQDAGYTDRNVRGGQLLGCRRADCGAVERWRGTDRTSFAYSRNSIIKRHRRFLSMHNLISFRWSAINIAYTNSRVSRQRRPSQKRLAPDSLMIARTWCRRAKCSP